MEYVFHVDFWKFVFEDLFSDTMFSVNGKTFLVMDRKELEKYVFELIYDGHDEIPYSFELIKNVTNISIDEIQKHFVVDVLLSSGVVHRGYGDNAKTYYVEGVALNDLINNIMSKEDFVEKMTEYLIDNNEVHSFISQYGLHKFEDGFYVYDVTN
jgi:hypothetical protein